MELQVITRLFTPAATAPVAAAMTPVLKPLSDSRQRCVRVGLSS